MTRGLIALSVLALALGACVANVDPVDQQEPGEEADEVGLTTEAVLG